jgi:cytochrome c oxidase cbb3-type subunit 3
MTQTARIVLVFLLVAAGGCDRESRRYKELPAAANRETGVRTTALEPGVPQQQAPVSSPYQGNAWGIGEGKRLYSAFNCSGCHGINGGGSIGPALIDDKWIYGAGPDQIYSTISQGRPDGMPAFGGHGDPHHGADYQHGPPQLADALRLDSGRVEDGLQMRHQRCPVCTGFCRDCRDSGSAAI